MAGVGFAQATPGQVLLFTVIAGAVGLTVGLGLAAVHLREQVSTLEVHEGPPRAWPAAQFELRDVFTKHRFGQFGSFDFSILGRQVPGAGLLSADGSTIAIVLPTHVTLISDYQGKTLTTTNVGGMPPTDYSIGQTAVGASVDHLLMLHRAGMTAVSDSGARLTRYTPANAGQAFMAMERSVPLSFSTTKLVRGLVRDAVARSRPTSPEAVVLSRRAIEQWSASPASWQNANQAQPQDQLAH